MEKIQKAAEKEGIRFTIMDQLFCVGEIMVDVHEGQNEEFPFQIWDNNTKELSYRSKQATRMIKKIKELSLTA